MIVTSKCAIKELWKLPDFFSIFHLFVSTIFLSRQFHYTSYLTCHIFPHIYAPILLIFHPFLRKKQAALVASRHSKCSGGDVRLFTLSESRRFKPVRTRSVTSNILAQQRRRNGTEKWRRRSPQCKYLRLITHEKILLNGDVPRRNGNVTYSVNRPQFFKSFAFKISVSDVSALSRDGRPYDRDGLAWQQACQSLQTNKPFRDVLRIGSDCGFETPENMWTRIRNSTSASASGNNFRCRTAG